MEAPSLIRVLRSRGIAFALATACAVFVAIAVDSVVTPLRLNVRLNARLSQLHGKRIAEDVVRRALLRIEELRAGARLILPEGAVSAHPERDAWVEMRRFDSRREVVCGLDRGERSQLYRGRVVRGVVRDCMLWPLGELEASEHRQGIVVESETQKRGRRLDAMPYQNERLWSEHDFVIDRSSLGRVTRGRHALHAANFRDADEVALAVLPEPSSLPNFELGVPRASRVIAAFRSDRDLVVRVRGHLWIGRPGHRMIVETRGHSVVLLVDGNVRIRGSVEMLGEDDQLFVIAGRPGSSAFRDSNGDGRRGANEPQLESHTRAALVPPLEGAGLIYLGDADSGCDVSASLIATQDLIVGLAGARVAGTVLCRQVTRVGEEPGVFSIVERRPLLDLDAIPRRGLPIVAESASIVRVAGLDFWRVRGRRTSAPPPRR